MSWHVWIIVVVAFLEAGTVLATETLSLAGQWRVQLDDGNRGLREEWQRQPLAGTTTITLPGTLDEAGLGPANPVKHLSRLSRKVEYIGPAWYQRDITIPAAWSGKHFELFLERCLWESRVWVDDQPAGRQESLVSPHRYDLSRWLTPGTHRLTLRVTNERLYDIGRQIDPAQTNYAHAYTEETQTRWNGVLGIMELRAEALVRVGRVHIDPDLAGNQCRVHVMVSNESGVAVERRLRMRCRLAGTPTNASPQIVEQTLQCRTGVQTFEMLLPMGEHARRWGEFDPALYELEVWVGDEPAQTTQFGFREVGTSPTHVLVNGLPVYLRGAIDCCAFPRLGHPPCDLNAWTQYFQTLRKHGLNHVRFHSWCPPEAAFQAADQTGVYLQPELPLWTKDMGKQPERERFLAEELERIQNTYGNHPSFVMLCLGNELEGDYAWLENMVKQARARDHRHLVSGSTARRQLDADQYLVTHKVADYSIQDSATMSDLDGLIPKTERLAERRIPVIAHEVGQSAVYPDYREMAQYNGVLEPRNYAQFSQTLEASHLADLAPEFVRSTLLFQKALYQNQIESCLRSRGLAGFQLLGFIDFPGQGTAPVGMLNVFHEPKGVVDAARFARYAGATVPLARFARRVYTDNETFSVKAEIFHYGEGPLRGAKPWLSMRTPEGRVYAETLLPSQDVPSGAVTSLGSWQTSLEAAPAPSRLTVRLTLLGTPYENEWDIWVYPARPLREELGAVRIHHGFDATLASDLQAGAPVLVFAQGQSKEGQSVQAGFLPVFWNPIMFPSQASRGLGLLCDPDHPMFRQFPNEGHANWQWRDLLDHASALELDGLPAEHRPTVFYIDNWLKNRRLGLIMEAHCEKGRVVICGLDLDLEWTTRPAARQLRRSLVSYMNSPAFAPVQTLSLDQVRKLSGSAAKQ